MYVGHRYIDHLDIYGLPSYFAQALSLIQRVAKGHLYFIQPLENYWNCDSFDCTLWYDNFHNPQPFARTQPSHTLFATKSVTSPFASTISTPLTNFQNFTYNTLPLPIKPLTFPLLTSYINFAEGDFGNCGLQRHQNMSTFLLLYHLLFLQLTSPLGVYKNPNRTDADCSGQSVFLLAHV